MVSDISCVLIICCIVSLQYVQPNLQNSEVILCRNCGYDVASSQYIFSKSSPNSYDNFNDTLFSKEEVLVEVFSTDIFFLYPIITFYHATCMGVGEWEEDTSWYPGYRWKPCVCPECGAFIGWVFEPINLHVVEPSKTFYGLILHSLIGETCNYLIIILLMWWIVCPFVLYQSVLLPKSKVSIITDCHVII